MTAPIHRGVLALLLLACGLRGAVRAGADETPPGAVPEPGLVAYRSGSELEAFVAERVRRWQARGIEATWKDYGQSAGGSPLKVLRMGGGEGAPAVLVHGGLAANDAAGTAAVLDLAERLASPEEDAARAGVRWLLVPAPNPEALEAFLAGRARAGGGNMDRDLDGQRGEDGPEDLDGDGEVRWMRRRQPLGAWAPGSVVGKEGTPERDERLVLERGVDASRATSYELRREGRDSDGDGQVDEDPPGLDLTRAFAGVWDHQGPWGGEGAFPGAAPEVRALMDLGLAEPGLVGWYGFSSEGPFLLRASEQGSAADADQALYDRLAPALSTRTGGVALRKASEGARGRNPGSDLDWASAHLGVVAVRIPVWRIAKQPGHAAERPAADELDWLLWADGHLPAGSFRPWTAFTHPELGAVELGGWARFTRHEPPAALLGEAVRAVSAGPLAQAGLLPALALQVEVRELGRGLYDLRARVLATGRWPSETPLAVARKLAHPVLLALEPAAGVELLAGAPRCDVGVVEAGQASAEQRWLLRGPAAAGTPEALGLLRARHRRAGLAVQEVRRP